MRASLRLASTSARYPRVEVEPLIVAEPVARSASRLEVTRALALLLAGHDRTLDGPMVVASLLFAPLFHRQTAGRIRRIGWFTMHRRGENAPTDCQGRPAPR